MPQVSNFYGIVIYMYYRDHPPPHFHAIYGDAEAVVSIAKATITAGTFPRRARNLVEEWAELHRDELQRDWDLARANQPLDPIPPLP